MTTETKTATLLGQGPFNGWFSEESFLFELYPPLETSGHSLVHVVTSGLKSFDRFPAETRIFAAHSDGKLDLGYYTEYGEVLELTEQDHPAEAMHRLGYNVVVMDNAVRV